MLITLSILLGSIILITWLVIYSANASTRKRRRQLLHQMEEAARQYAAEWVAPDIGKHRAFAWSRSGDLFFFADFSPDAQEQVQVIRTDTVEDCRLTSPQARNTGGTPARTELKISLSDRSLIVITLYDELKDGIFEKTKLTEKAQELRKRFLDYNREKMKI